MVSPHQYAQQARQDLVASITSEAADMVLARFDAEPDIVARIVGVVPASVPVKYHRLIYHILINACVNAICKKSTYEIPMLEKVRMARQAMMYMGNVRES